MKDLENRISPEKIIFRKNHITVKVSQREIYRIFYRDLVWTYIRTFHTQDGNYEEPGIEDITEDTEGELVLCDKMRCSWIIETDQIGQKAGEIMRELCMYAPYVLAGGQDWFDRSEEADFDMISEMVKIRRECGK